MVYQARLEFRCDGRLSRLTNRSSSSVRTGEVGLLVSIDARPNPKLVCALLELSSPSQIPVVYPPK